MGQKRTFLIASDHAGYEFKEMLKSEFDERIEWIDLGTHSTDSVDYPDYGYAMGEAIDAGKASEGILICGSGIGIAIAANRNPNVRAALCTDATMAKFSRTHNDANVLVLGARVTGPEIAKSCIEAFLDNEFEGGRHQGRVNKLNRAC